MGKSKIIIADYNSRWPGMFEEEKERLLHCIGQWVLDIEHIGSTAVVGLGAKPVIDIMIGVQTLKTADTYCLTPMVGLGYEYVKKYEKEMPYRRYFHKNDPRNSFGHHIHLVEKGSEFWKRHLLFRDYLRANEEAAGEYERLKRFLAPQFTDGNEYAVAKTDFIKGIEAKAFEMEKRNVL